MLRRAVLCRWSRSQQVLAVLSQQRLALMTATFGIGSVGSVKLFVHSGSEELLDELIV